MAKIEDYNFAGKRAIVRVDFNVPLDESGHITDDTRIRGAIPTLKKILNDGGSLILMSHMGKPKGKVNPRLSLLQIRDAVAKALGTDVQFAPDCMKAREAADSLKPGQVLLLENLRFYPEEEGKPVGIDKADPGYKAAAEEMKMRQKEFARILASYANVYVNDAFGTAHRKHASTAVIADYFKPQDKMLGFLMDKEVAAVDKILKNIQRPFTAIMGGSKVSTKIGIIENLMDKVDNLILCGGMTYTFAKAQGGHIGNSLCEDDKLQLALDIIAKAKEKGVNLVLGTDCVAADAFSNDARTQVCPVGEIPDGWMGLPRLACHRRGHRRSHRQRCLLPGGRRRFRGLRQQVRPGRLRLLRLHRRRRPSRGHRGQDTTRRGSRQRRQVSRNPPSFMGGAFPLAIGALPAPRIRRKSRRPR